MGWTRFKGVLPVPMTVTAPDMKVVPLVDERYPADRLFGSVRFL